MARLNEPPMPAESLESLKRRFIRQNRDLARHNSQQSLKIRMLESELARLRAENVAICEENIQLNSKISELHNGAFTPPDFCALAEQEAIQRELEDKIKEFDALVGKLSEANTRSRTGNERKRRRRSEILAASNVEILSPNTRRLRRAVERGEADTIQQDNGALEGRMPAILEGKAYPRRTMETREIQHLLLQATDSDSPDLGPPPTTFLDREDASEDYMQSETLASISLGRRRRSAVSRQQDPMLALGDEVSVAEDASIESKSETQKSQRPGSKRKWETQDQRNPAVQTTSKTANRFPASSKKPEIGTAKGEGANGAKARGEFSDRESGRTASRKVLACKPVNNDPVVSPRKIETGDSKNRIDKPIRSHSAATDKTASTRPARKSQAVQGSKVFSVVSNEPQEAVVNTVEIKLEPKTPGLVLDNLFSPSESQPQDLADGVRPDTPPPMTTSAGGIEGPTGIRGSRRVRAQVSYAEPSLNSKMRRAGEKMDAVAGSVRHSLGAEGRGRSSSAHIETESAQKERMGSAQPSTSLKRNQTTSTAEDGNEAPADDKSNTLSNPLKARLDALAQDSVQDKEEAATVTSRTAISNRRRQSQRPQQADVSNSLRTLEAADIFDVTESPSSSSSGITGHQPLVTALKSSSSTSTLSRPSNRRQTLAANTITATSTGGRSGSSGSEQTATQVVKRDATGVRSSISTTSIEETAQPSGPLSRAERVAARRRSMML